MMFEILELCYDWPVSKAIDQYTELLILVSKSTNTVYAMKDDNQISLITYSLDLFSLACQICNINVAISAGILWRLKGCHQEVKCFYRINLKAI